MRNATPAAPFYNRPASHPNRGAGNRRKLLAKREAWLRQIEPTSLFYRLFDLIPGVYFFAKNRRGQVMFLNRNNCEHARLKNEMAAIGLTDFDLNPTIIASSFAQDDATIYATGEPILNRVELWVDRVGIPNWFVVNKMPIRSRAGKIIGVMGFSQSYEGRAKILESDSSLSKAVNYIRKNFNQDITIRDLAKMAGLSARQLERRFQVGFQLGPQQFLIKTRLLESCRSLLQTKQTICEIAHGCGFSDQSAYTRHFRRHLGVTPRAFRNRKRLL